MGKEETLAEAKRREEAVKTCTHPIVKVIRNGKRLLCDNCGLSMPNEAGIANN